MDFVIIANDWSAGIDNPTSKHRIAIELAKRGNRVLWLEGAGMRQPALTSGADRSRLVNKLKKLARPPRPAAESADLRGKIWVLTPPMLPMPHKEWARKFNGWTCKSSAVFWSRRLGFERPRLINYTPILAEAMAQWPWQRIYHCVDRWDAFGMYDSNLMADMDARCCRYAGTVIASSGDLMDRCRRYNQNVSMVLHGVDYAHFAKSLDAPRAADLPAGDVVGFFGLVSEWLDQELLVKLARALPSSQVVLIGRPDVDTTKLQGISNLHLMGPRPFRALPSYVGHFAVGLIPFEINELTRAVNPIKLREMLAGGCPVVSTALPEVERLAGPGVDVAHGHDEFIRQVQQRLAKPLSAADRRAVSATMQSETWSGKVDQMLSIISAEKSA